MSWMFGDGPIAKGFYEPEWLLQEGNFLPVDLKCRPYMVLRQGKDQPWHNFYWDCVFFCYKWTIEVWSSDALEAMCYTSPPFEDRFILKDGPTYETAVLAFGGKESKTIWDRVSPRFALKDGEYFEFNSTFDERDLEILTFILQKRIKRAKPQHPVLVAVRSPFEFSLLDDELDFTINENQPTPSVLGGLFFYKNVCFYLDPYGADGKYPDFFYPVETDWIMHPSNDFDNDLTVDIPVIGAVVEPIITPILDPSANILHSWDTVWGLDVEREPMDDDNWMPFDFRPLFIQELDNWLKNLPNRVTTWYSDKVLSIVNSRLTGTDFDFSKNFFKKIARFFSPSE